MLNASLNNIFPSFLTLKMSMTNVSIIFKNEFVFFLTGDDCIGCAKTGSGKTAAFALPILQKLAEDPFGIFALVLTPTRLVN